MAVAEDHSRASQITSIAPQNTFADPCLGVFNHGPLAAAAWAHVETIGFGPGGERKAEALRRLQACGAIDEAENYRHERRYYHRALGVPNPEAKDLSWSDMMVEYADQPLNQVRWLAFRHYPWSQPVDDRFAEGWFGFCFLNACYGRFTKRLQPHVAYHDVFHRVRESDAFGIREKMVAGLIAICPHEALAMIEEELRQRLDTEQSRPEAEKNERDITILQASLADIPRLKAQICASPRIPDETLEPFFEPQVIAEKLHELSRRRLVPERQAIVVRTASATRA